MKAFAKQVVVAVSLLISILSVEASAKALFGPEMVFKMEAGRNIFFQQAQGDADKPTLVFLPGVNRALPENYPAFQLLAAQGYGILITATSSHWQSLVTLENQQTPYFEKNSKLTAADFNLETETLLKALNIKKPIIVSLSYSSAMAASTQLKKIYVAPMVKAADSNPSGAQAAAQWEATLALNPFFGKVWIRQFRDSNYRKHWTPIVQENHEMYGDGANLEQILAGYVSISRSAEDFDLKKASFASPGDRQFIFGENELQNRLRGQFEAVLKAMKDGPTRVLIIKNAQHNVPQSQPKSFETAMLEILLKKSTTALKVGVIDPRKSQEIRWLTTAETQNLFTLVLALPDVTEPADLSSVLGK